MFTLFTSEAVLCKGDPSFTFPLFTDDLMLCTGNASLRFGKVEGEESSVVIAGLT